MIINLKAALDMYHLSLAIGRMKVCDLSVQDPDFNKGKGKRFFRAFDRAVARGDFKNSKDIKRR